MGKMRFKLNIAGVDALRKSPEMQDILNQYGAEAAAQAGDGYDYEVKVHTKRAVVDIRAETREARRDNLENNTLLKVVKL